MVPRFLPISYSERRRLSCVPSSKIGESFSLDKMERVESRPDTFSPSSLNLPHFSSLLLQMGARGTEEEGRRRRRRDAIATTRKSIYPRRRKRKRRRKNRFITIKKITLQETPSRYIFIIVELSFGLPGLQKRLPTSVYRLIFVEGPHTRNNNRRNG